MRRGVPQPGGARDAHESARHRQGAHVRPLRKGAAAARLRSAAAALDAKPSLRRLSSSRVRWPSTRNGRTAWRLRHEARSACSSMKASRGHRPARRVAGRMVYSQRSPLPASCVEWGQQKVGSGRGMVHELGRRGRCMGVRSIYCAPEAVGKSGLACGLHVGSIIYWGSSS